MPTNSRSPLPFVPLTILVGIFYLNFLARIVMAPLLPIVEEELGLGHGQAGSLFFFVAFGYGVGLLGSGFVSSLLTHRLTIAFAGITGGIALILISRSTSIGGIHVGLVFIGTFAGVYFPSGMATLTELVSREHWGKAMAVHELAPNLAFITTPLLAEFLLRFFTWRTTLDVLGVATVLLPVLFLFWGRGSRKRGEPPRFKTIQEILAGINSWAMATFFAVAIGASYGVYTMLPLFLVSGLGMERLWANTLIGLSRTFSIIALSISGIMIDRIGPQRAMTTFLATTGLLVLLLGLFHDPTLISILVFFQAASVACLFPVGLTIVSLIFPERLRVMAISLVILMGFLLGGGGIPPALGYWAEAFSFSSGFALFGVLILALLPLFWRVGNRMNLSR